jgi:glycosyltransferase involved in cell wall biosynthesis
MIQGGKTGVAQYVLALLRALVARRDRLHLTLFVLENEAVLFAAFRDRVELRLVPERFRSPIRNIAWHQMILPRWARAHHLDVLHVPSYRRLLWRKPCALVATIHDLAPFHVPDKYDPTRMFYGRVVVRALARRQDRLIAVSSNTAMDLKRFFGIGQDRVHVIPNGVDHERFNPGDPVDARAECAKRWNLDQSFFLYVSRLEHPGKNHVRLIEAFAQFKSATGSDWLLALGGSDWHGAETIHAVAEQSRARQDIRFLGFVADADLPILYRAAGAFVYPSLFEGFGLPPVEAMACGCPVLSSTRGALKEVIAEAAGVLEPENIGQMQLSLTRIAANLKWRDQLRSAGLQNAARFNWTDNAAQVVQCYRRALEGV